MSKYILTDFENNGYHDSYFYCTYYDDATDTIGIHQYGATAFVSPTTIGFSNGVSTVQIEGEALLAPSKEAVEKARLKLRSMIHENLLLQEDKMINNPAPEAMVPGTKIKLKSSVKNQMYETVPCGKCSGTGSWTNPKNTLDVRPCFYCDKGFNKGSKIKENGKLKYNILDAGLTGIVTSSKSFGTFYRSGYNQPDENNTTVSFVSYDGRQLRAGLKNIKLDQDCRSSDELLKVADKLSYNYSFSAIMFPKFAWDTHNFAAGVK